MPPLRFAVVQTAVAAAVALLRLTAATQWAAAMLAYQPALGAPALALLGVLSGALAIGGAARRAGRPRVSTTYGSARWADVADIRKAGLLSDEGIVLGRHASRYLRHDGPEHVLAVAPTRSGK